MDSYSILDLVFLLLVLAAVALFAGCAATNWTKAGVTEEQRTKDIGECQMEVQRLAAWSVPGSSFNPYSAHAACMMARGYQRS